MKINLGREVVQYTPEVYKNSEDYDFVTHKQFEALLKKSGLVWNDVQYVYLFISRDIDTSKRKEAAVNTIQYYFQCADGHYDYKYVHGLDFLVSVRNIHQEMIKFFMSEGVK